MEKIKAADLWHALDADNRLLIDVRSPAEYARAHIPNAVNLPLFNDEERAKVGTIYKQISPESALLKGLEIVGTKMSGFVKKVIKWSPNRRLILYCWRGGKRSGSVAWLLRFAGFDVVTIEGGYKHYRNLILQTFDNQHFTQLIVLGGKTGSGKTAILNALEEQGEQVIDLEKIAHHKGSAFGWIGEKPQQTTEQFENDLYDNFRKIDPLRRVWVENESRSIGSVFIAQGFWNQMKQAPLIHLEIPLDLRITHLINIYANTSIDDLKASFEKIKKKIGFDQAKFAIEALEKGDLEKAATIALKYYDKSYTFDFDENKTLVKHILDIPYFNPKKAAEELINFANVQM